MIFNEVTKILEIENQEFVIYDFKREIRLNVDYSDISHLMFRIDDFHQKVIIRVKSPDGFGTSLFNELEFFKTDNKITFVFICDNLRSDWKKVYGFPTFLITLIEQINLSEDIFADLETFDIENDYKYLEVCVKVENDFLFSDFVNTYSKRLSVIIKQTELLLSGVIWKKEYEKDEKLFCLEILYPLIRKMGYLDVRFTHGIKEFGKDFTFSDVTKFGNLRHYGMQVKAGNMRGNVNADIDEIMGQLDDAFSMPYYEVSANEERRINTFIIAISGNFTENAKEKIVHKIPNNLKGSVYLLDREKILELVERYWK
jgi:hypothetical protein